MILVVFGKRGKGKTYFLKEVVRRSVLPCIVVDTLREYRKEAVLAKITDDIRYDMFKLRFVPDTVLDFDIVCRCVSEQVSRAGINFVIDEVDMFTSSHKLPLNFERCLRYSRHYKVNMYMSVRNPVELNRKISALADRFVVFNITEPRYLDYFDRYQEGISTVIRRLPKYKYVEVNL